MNVGDNAKPTEGRGFIIFILSAIAIAAIFAASSILASRAKSPLKPEITQSVAPQRAAPETPEQKEVEGREAEKLGEHIDYADFYAKALSANLVVGKRYRFRADITKALFLNDPYAPSGVYRQLDGNAAFDDNAQYEAFLKNSSPSGEVVASLGDDGRIMVHRVD